METLIGIIIFAAIVFIITLKSKYENMKHSLEQSQKMLTEIQAENRNKIENLNNKFEEYRNKTEEENISKLESLIKKHKTEIDTIEKKYKEFIEVQNRECTTLLEKRKNSLPNIASMISDYLTIHYLKSAEFLEKKSNPAIIEAKRIRDLRAETKEWIKNAKEAIYQVEYLKSVSPIIEELLDSEVEDISKPIVNLDYDPIRDYLTKDEWNNLSESEKNQKALDNYLKRNKTKSQIGRDYELFVGQIYEKAGYKVTYYVCLKGFEDLGRDIIAKKGPNTIIVQCKYWSTKKVIHEKHIAQLYGTVIKYMIENNVERNRVLPVFYTSTVLSDMAKEFADCLGVNYYESEPFIEFPRIKCNIGKDSYGHQTKIYHLPMDQQYNSTEVNKPGEFYAFTVKEAEDKGFRRAWKYFNT